MKLPVEYRTVTGLSGPLLTVECVKEVPYDSLVEIAMPDGSKRRGRVLETDSNRAVVQVFEGTDGLDTDNTSVTFLGKGKDSDLTIYKARYDKCKLQKGDIFYAESVSPKDYQGRRYWYLMDYKKI